MGGSGYSAIPTDDPLKDTFTDKDGNKGSSKKCCIISLIAVIVFLAAVALVVVFVLAPFLKHKKGDNPIVIENYRAYAVIQHGPKIKIIQMKSKTGKYFENNSFGGRYSYSMDGKYWNQELLFDRSIIHVVNYSENAIINITDPFEKKHTDVDCPDIKPYTPVGVVPTEVGKCDYYELIDNSTTDVVTVTYLWISKRRPVIAGQQVYYKGALYDSADEVFIQFEEKTFPDSDFEPPKDVLTIDLTGFKDTSGSKSPRAKPMNYHFDFFKKMVLEELLPERRPPYPLNDVVNPFTSGWNFEMSNGRIVQVRDSLMSNIPTKKNVRETLDEIGEDNIPEAYDVRSVYGNICPTTKAITNQGNCGCCWAMATSGVFADRACIASNGTINSAFSPQYLINCQNSSFGCNGGHPPYAWRDMIKDGIVTEQCQPFVGVNQKCSADLCSDQKTKPQYYYAKSAYSPFFAGNWTENMKVIQAEIMKHGPVGAVYYVFPDFISYTGGVYRHKGSTEFLGSHAVRVLGWGKDEKEGDYWIVANSWGNTWAEQGTFRIARGNNECGFEDIIAAGEVQV